MNEPATKPPPAPLDAKDYEIKWLEERNKQLRQRITLLEQQLTEPCDCEWRPKQEKKS